MKSLENFDREFFIKELREIIHQEISINQRPSNKVIMDEVEFPMKTIFGQIGRSWTVL